jgi:hypothetical protein
MPGDGVSAHAGHEIVLPRGPNGVPLLSANYSGLPISATRQRSDRNGICNPGDYSSSTGFSQSSSSKSFRN